MKNKAAGWVKNRIKPHAASIVLLVGCDGLLSVCAVAFAYLSRSFIDTAIESGMTAASGAGALLVLVAIAHIGLFVLSHLLTESVNGKLSMSLQNSLLQAALSKRSQADRDTHSGEVLNRLFSDTAVVANGVTGILPTAAAVITRLIAVFWVLWLLDGYLIIAFVLMGGLMFLLSRLLRPHIKRLHKNTQQAEDKTRAVFKEALDRATIIKAYSKQSTVAAGAQLRQTAHLKARMAKARLTTCVSSGFVLFFRAAYIGVMIYCALRLARGDSAMTFGTLMALLQLVSQVQQPFASLSGIMPRYYAMLSSAERLMQLEYDPELAENRDTSAIYDKMRSIIIDRVTFSYGREEVLKDACATIEKGSFTLISGATGAGKTSLFMLLMGMYDHAGSIVTDCGDRLDEGSRGMFAYVPQGNMLFSGSVADNVCFGAVRDERRLEDALRISCCDGFVSALPQGADTPIGSEGSALSEGQAQRIAVARAIYSGAPVLLLDEPTSALDGKTEQNLLENLKTLGKTVIIISHKSAARDVATRELELKNGRLTVVK